MFDGFWKDSARNVRARAAFTEKLEKQRRDIERANALLADSTGSQPAVNPDGTVKDDDKNWFASVGTALVAGSQQMGASFLDALVQGGALVEGSSIAINPFISESERARKSARLEDRTNAIRDKIQSWTDITGENMQNRRTDEAADRLSRGEGSFGDFTSVAGRSLEDASTATMFLNPTSTAASGLKFSSEVAKRGVKEIIKDAVKQSATFGAVDATAEGLSTYGETGDVGESVKAGAIAGVTSFGIQSGLEIGGSIPGAVRNRGASNAADIIESAAEDTAETSQKTVDIDPEKAERNKRVNEQLDERLVQINRELQALREGSDPSVVRLTANDGTDVTAVAQRYDQEVQKLETKIRDLQAQAEGRNVNGKAEAPEGVDPSEYTGDIEGRAKAAEEIPKLRQQIEDLRAEQAEQFEMLGGVQETIDTQAARTKFQDLKREKRTAVDWKIRNGIGETLDSINAKIEDLDRGVVPDEVVTPRPEVTTVEEAFRRASASDADDISSVQRATIINDVHKAAIEDKISKLWTPERHQAFIAELDENYKLAEQQIREYPGPRQAEELEQLESDYNAQRIESQLRLAEDADELNAALEAQRIAEDIDARIIEQWNSVERTDPAAFGDVDDDALTQIRRSLEVKRTEQKMREGKPVSETEKEGAVQTAIENADDAAEASEIIDASPELSNAQQSLMADMVTAGDFKGSHLDYLLFTPRNRFKKLVNGEKMLQVFDAAQEKIAKANGELIERTERYRWGQLWKSDAVREQSIKWLDEGTEITKLPRESDRAFKARQEALNDVRDWFNTTGKAIGLDESTMLNNYFPHMFEKTYGVKVDQVAEALLRLKEGKNANGNPLTDKQRNKLMQSLRGVDAQTREAIERAQIYKVGKNGALEKRRGAEGWNDDIPFVISEYHRMAMKTAHMEPAIKQVNEMTVGLEKQQQQYIDEFVKTWKGDPSTFDQRLPGKTKEFLQTTRRLSNLGLMGLSARTVALQIFGAANNFIDSEGFGGDFLASGMRAFIATKKPSFMGGISELRSEFISNGGLDGSFSGYLRSGKGFGAKMSKVEKAFFGGISFVDEQMRMQAFDMGRRQYAKSIGKDFDSLTKAERLAANKAGVVKANETQFSTTPLDVPLAQNNELGKVVFQMQQFNMKQLGFNVGVLFGEKGLYNPKTGKLTGKGAERLVKMIVGYSALYAAFTQFGVPGDEDSQNFFGFDWEDVLPFGEQTVYAADKVGSWFGLSEGESEIQGTVPPLYSVLFGRGGADKGLVGTVKEYGEEDNDPMSTTGKIAKSLFRNFVPGGTQAVRSAEGAQAVMRGESMNDSGSTRFLIDNDSGWNIIKGLVAGQYATTEGQRWLEEGMNTISKKQTIQLPDGSKMPVSEYVRNYIEDPDDKAQWIGYYSAKQNADKELAKVGRKTDDIVRNIRLRLTAGRISQAEANIEIERHNQIIRELYRPYFDGNKNVPKYVTMDFLDSVMVGEAKPYNFQNNENSELLEEFAQ